MQIRDPVHGHHAGRIAHGHFRPVSLPNSGDVPDRSHLAEVAMRSAPRFSHPSRVACLTLAALLCACSHIPGVSEPPVPAFVRASGPLEAEAALELTEPAEPLVMSPAMRRFSERFLHSEASPQRRVEHLHRLLLSSGGLGLHYDGLTTATAAEAFEQRQANCLTFSHLFIALARDAGLDARYQLVRLAPAWQREEDWVLVMQHVNVTGRLPAGGRYVADVDRRARHRQLDSRTLTDRQALAHHYNNLAMEALVAGYAERAYAYLVRAIHQDAREAFLWTNLGTILAYNDQLADARSAFLQALELDRRDVLAMRKYVATLGEEADSDPLARSFAGRIARLERDNPYRLAARAHQHASREEWEPAWSLIERAIDLKPGDPDFYTLGVTALSALERQEEAARLEQRARRASSEVKRR